MIIRNDPKKVYINNCRMSKKVYTNNCRMPNKSIYENQGFYKTNSKQEK